MEKCIDSATVPLLVQLPLIYPGGTKMLTVKTLQNINLKLEISHYMYKDSSWAGFCKRKQLKMHKRRDTIK